MPQRMMLAPPENVMVQCENLVKIYKTTDVEVMALQGLDLTVERGELMRLVRSMQLWDHQEAVNQRF